MPDDPVEAAPSAALMIAPSSMETALVCASVDAGALGDATAIVAATPASVNCDDFDMESLDFGTLAAGFLGTPPGELQDLALRHVRPSLTSLSPHF